eukprot:433942_1
MATDLEMVDKKIDDIISQKMEALIAQKVQAALTERDKAGNDYAETAEKDVNYIQTEMEQCTHNEQTWPMIARKFAQSAEDEDLDIYQMCAWMSYQDSIPTTKKYFYYFKAIVCFAIQVPGLIIFIYSQLFNIIFSENGIGLCSMRSSTDSNLVHILSVMFAVYISVKLGGIVSDVGKRGLYNMNFWSGMNCPPFCSRHWVFFGGYTNITTILFSIYGSYLVLYVSDDILDVILNSIALFFIAEVDDFMLDKADYQRVQVWFQNKYDENQDCGNEHDKLTCCSSIVASRILTPMHFMFTGLALFGAVFAPIWIAVCH